jgi:hypothetical protein
LFQNKAKDQMKQNKTDIDNMLASLLDISSACTLSTEFDHASQSVRMLKTLEFQRRICSLDLELEHDFDEERERLTYCQCRFCSVSFGLLLYFETKRTVYLIRL